VAALDRIRIWLPVLLALSANSPFWHGTGTGFASYRYQAWTRWPTAGPTDVFGTAAAYDDHRRQLLGTQVPLDAGMLHFDARLCEHHPTVEVRIADVCLNAAHAAVIAALVRALVETAARAWAAGDPAPDVPASLLRIWSWQASRCGVEERLIDPATGTPAPAGDVIARLLDAVRPVLAKYEEEEAVEAVLADILRHGTGARYQRAAYAVRHEVRDVVAAALEVTHHDSPDAPTEVLSTLDGGEGAAPEGTPTIV
jgi:carboxylate-amine ligase